MAESPDAQLVDLAFMTELVEASGNVVFVLILNTVRRLYFENADLLEAVAAPDLAPLYERAARAIAAGEATRAANAIAKLAGEQERRLLRMKVLTPREASIFACITDTVVAPEPVLPAGARDRRRGLPRPLAGRARRRSTGSACAGCSTRRSSLRGRWAAARRLRALTEAERVRRSSPPRRCGGPRCARS